MCRNINNRDSLIISLHTHNDAVPAWPDRTRFACGADPSRNLIRQWRAHRKSRRRNRSDGISTCTGLIRSWNSRISIPFAKFTNVAPCMTTCPRASRTAANLSSRRSAARIRTRSQKGLAERKKNKKLSPLGRAVFTIGSGGHWSRISRSHSRQFRNPGKAVSLYLLEKVNFGSCCRKTCNASSARLPRRRWTNSVAKSRVPTHADVWREYHQAHFAWQLKALRRKAKTAFVKCRAMFYCATKKPVRVSGSATCPLAALVHGFSQARVPRFEIADLQRARAQFRRGSQRDCLHSDQNCKRQITLGAAWIYEHRTAVP